MPMIDRMGHPFIMEGEPNDTMLSSVVSLCKELYEKWSEFDYGIPVDGRIKSVPSAEYYYKNYRFLSPKEFEQYGGGVCWDFVEYGRDFLERKGSRSFHTYYIITDTPPNYDTHTFIVCEVEGKFVYVESSFKKIADEIKGVKAFDSLEQICNGIVRTMFHFNGNEKFSKIKFDVFEFKGHPPYGCTCDEYMNWIQKHGKIVYQNSVENPIKNKSVINESEGNLCISYAMGVNDSILKLKDLGFIIKEGDGDFAVAFDSSLSDIWEKFIYENIQDTYWNEYINLTSYETVFMIKENNEIRRIVNRDFRNDKELLDICNRLCEGDFKTIEELILSNDFYRDCLMNKIMSLAKAKDIAKHISSQVEKDRKPPTGNQNCQLCTWCAEAQFRGMDVLPRPIYSPRDPALNIVGETIVKDPVRKSFSSFDDLEEQIQEIASDTRSPHARIYCHVNWEGSEGGHEFLILKIDNKRYIMDPQAGTVVPLDDTDDHFKNVNYSNSYIARLDNREFNDKLFKDMNDPSKTLPWDPVKDIEYLRKNGMLSKEDEKSMNVQESDIESPRGRYLTFEELERYTGIYEEGMIENGTPIKVNDFPFDKVYVGTHEYFDDNILKPEKILFVTPYPGIASIFTTDRKLYQCPRGSYNLGYDEWEKDLDDLWEPFDTIHVRIEGAPDYPERTFKATGYIYEIDVSELKDRIYRYHWMSDGVEFLIMGLDKIPISERIEWKHTVVVRGAERHHHDTVQESFDIGIRDVLPEGISARQATKSDVDTILWMELETLPEKYKSDPKVIKMIREDAEWSVSFTTVIIDTKLNKTIGIYQSRETDYSANENSGDWWYLAHIYILPEYRSKGIGRTVISYDISKHDKIVLRVSVDNVKAQKLYKSLGFEITDEYDGGYIMRLDKTQHIQEGTKYKWQDIKNGVNPDSSKLFFHVSFDKELAENDKVLEPRLPSYIADGNYVENGYHENTTTPRVCFSPSIEGCLNAIMSDYKRIRLGGKELYVYVPEKPISEYKIKNNKEIIRDKDVFDANATGEIWVLEPVKLKLYGTIMVDRVRRRRKVHVVDPDSPAKLNVYKYEWHWQYHPRLLKESDNMTNDRSIQDLRLFMEAEEEEKEKKESKSKKDDDDDLDPGKNLGMSFDEGDDSDDKGDDKKKDDGSDDDDDLSTFGSDDGSSPNNEYDEKELDVLNRLIASEQSAIAEYFEAAKSSNVDILRRLYSDIGAEESFHAEQLLFAKAELTGEHYEPRDPDVKKEYEELLEMGMDEESALNTALDKKNLFSGEEDDGDDSDLEEIQKDLEALEEGYVNTMASCDLLLTIQEMAAYKNHGELRKAYMEFADVFMEAVDNVSTKEGSAILGTNNPFLIIGRGIMNTYKFIISLVKKMKNYVNKRRIKNKRAVEWLKNHGIKGLFSSGIKLYFFNDKTGSIDISGALSYIDLLHRITVAVANKCKINPPDVVSIGNSQVGEFKTKTEGFATIAEGVDKVNGAVFTKSKVIVTDQNEASISDLFFGYSASKFVSDAKTEGGQFKGYNSVKSVNIYNTLQYISDLINGHLKGMEKFMQDLQQLEGNMKSLFYTHNDIYKECVNGIKAVSKGYQMILKCITSDLNTCMKLDQALLNATNGADQQVTQNVNDSVQATGKANWKKSGQGVNVPTHADGTARMSKMT